VAKTKKLRVGDGMNPEIEIGPMIHERQLALVAGQVQDAVAAGATVLTGGRVLTAQGPNFYEPTVLTGVNHSMRIMREETFGPVLCIMPFESEDEAVALANDTEFGLGASVWTRDRARGEQVARRIHAGTVMVNDAIVCFGVSEAPHGGMGQSGIGRTHGRAGLEEMVQHKYLDADYTVAVPKVWWYGYSAVFARQMDGFVNFLFSKNLGERLSGGLRSAGAFVRKGRV
jgi:succinate-semialdehyde dehydrogenase/glutarate-semialdehyde dehydrogenase